MSAKKSSAAVGAPKPSKASAKAAKAAKKTARKRAAPGATSTQDLYTGKSGEYVAMSEFLWRGYNVAVPAIDVGEDVFVVEAEHGVLRRVQVKTAGTGTVNERTKTVRFTLSRAQLNVPLNGSVLFFMLMTRWDDIDATKSWRFILIRWDEVNRLRTTRPEGRRGRPPAADADAGDELAMNVTFTDNDATAWGHSLRDYLDTWPSPDWDVAGPMKARAAAAAAPAATPPVEPGAAPARVTSVDLGTTPRESARSTGAQKPR